jgi:hypothetical protein
MSSGPWSHVQEVPSGTFEQRLLRIQQASGRQAPVRSLGGGRLRRLGRFLAGLGRPAHRSLTLEDALPCLLPKVRTRSEQEAYARLVGRPVASRPLAGNLAVSLVACFANQDRDLDPAQVQAWNADFDLLLQRARGNLLGRVGAGRFRAVREGCWRSTWANGLDASLVLLPGILRRLPVRGDPVAVPVGHDALLVTGTEDPGGLAWALASTLDHLNAGPDPRPATPLRLRDSAWEPLRLPENHPAAALLDRLASAIPARCCGAPEGVPAGGGKGRGRAA